MNNIQNNTLVLIELNLNTDNKKNYLDFYSSYCCK